MSDSTNTWVKVNPKALRTQEFHPCTPDFIREVCHASCCRSSSDPSGIAVVVAPDEYGDLEARGAVIDHDTGRIQPVNRRCPFQGIGDLCVLHTAGRKPRGCVISPFTFNEQNTLIVRNRYRMLKCFNAPGAVPVYVAHRSSLDMLFGRYADDLVRACEAFVDTPLHFPVATTLVDELKHKNVASKGDAA